MTDLVTILNIDDHILEQTLEFDAGLVKYRDFIAINPMDIQDAFVKQPARLAWLGELLARAKAAHLEAKAETKRVYSTVELEVRERADNPPYEKLTEAGVKARVTIDNDYIAAQKEEAEAQYRADMLETMVRAFYQRGELLQSIGANLRKEMEYASLETKLRRND